MNDSLEITRVETDEGLGEIRVLFREYEASLDFDLDFQDFEEEMADLPGKYAPPEGCILIATAGDDPAGCVALRKLEDWICEMKRLYVRPRFRGLRIGAALASAIADEARRIGYGRMRLDTVVSMKEARSLYTSMGFEEIAAYCHNPLPNAAYMELRLEDRDEP